MPGSPPKYNLPTSSFKNYKRTEALDSILKIQPWERSNVNPSARVYPYNYTPKFSKYGFLEKQKDENQLLGVAGFGFPRKGINLDFVGIKPLDNNPYFKGVLGGGVSKQIGNFNVGASVDTAITGYPDRSGNFIKDKTKLNPKLKLKYNFKNGGKLNLKEAFEIHNQGGGTGRISLEEFASLVPKSDWGMTYFEMAEKYGWEGSDKLKKAEAEGKIKSLKNGGAMAPIIPTYYKSKGTPIYRDTTDAPPRIFEGGGRMTQQQLAEYIDKNPNALIQDINLPETVVYGDQEKKKLQGNLFQKLNQLKRATINYYNDRGFGKMFLKQDPTSEVGAMQQNVNAYKENLENEKNRYVKAEAALKNLKKYMPEVWKDKKLKDVFSTSGYNNLRKLFKEGDISKGTFLSFYDNFAGEYDPFMAKGKGKGAVYDAQEARRVWGDDYPEFINMISKFALAAPLVGAAGAFSGPISSALASTARGAGAGWSALSQPIIGSTNALGMYSGAAPALSYLTPGLALEGYGAYYLGDQLGDKNSNMRKSWRNVAEDTNLGTIDKAVGATAFPILGASGTLLKTAGAVIPKVIGAGKTIANVPQIRTAGTGIKEVWNKPYRWNELGKQRSVYRFEQPHTKNLTSNVKANPKLDVTKGRWYQDKSNPEFDLYSKTNPNARRFTGSEAAVKRYNLEAIQNRMAAGEKVSGAERVAVERSIGSMNNPKMQNYVNEVKINFGESRAKQVEELVRNPNNYWDFKTFKTDPVNRLLLRSAPVNKSEYLLPNKFAFEPVRKTSELKNMSSTDKFNYFKNLGSEYGTSVAQTEARVGPKIAELFPSAGKIGKTTKVADASGLDPEIKEKNNSLYLEWLKKNSEVITTNTP